MPPRARRSAATTERQRTSAPTYCRPRQSLRALFPNVYPCVSVCRRAYNSASRPTASSRARPARMTIARTEHRFAVPPRNFSVSSPSSPLSLRYVRLPIIATIRRRVASVTRVRHHRVLGIAPGDHRGTSSGGPVAIDVSDGDAARARVCLSSSSSSASSSSHRRRHRHPALRRICNTVRALSLRRERARRIEV